MQSCAVICIQELPNLEMQIRWMCRWVYVNAHIQYIQYTNALSRFNVDYIDGLTYGEFMNHPTLTLTLTWTVECTVSLGARIMQT